MKEIWHSLSSTTQRTIAHWTVAVMAALLVVGPLASAMGQTVGLSENVSTALGFASAMSALVWWGRKRQTRRQAVLNSRPKPRIFRSPREAESIACDWLRYIGYQDAELTRSGPDGGIDLESRQAIGQVKAEMKRCGRPVIQQTFGVGRALGKDPYVFALAGFTRPAIEWADENGVSLFEFNHAGEIEAVNRLAALRLKAADDRAFRHAQGKAP